MMNKLKMIREDCQISQSQLARLSGVSIRTIQAYEAGARDLNLANGETLYRLAHSLKVPIEKLLDICANDAAETWCHYLDRIQDTKE